MKDSFSSIPNKKVFLLVFGLLLLVSLLVPLYSAQAEWWNPISWGDELKDALTGIIVTVVTFIPAFIFFIVAGLANWAIGTVTTIGVIPGAAGTPSFVQVGWEISRNIINGLFVIILVFIGLATILRLQTYQLQKTLPSLIIIALLVNFSAVLVGFIVDISNIITNVFLSATGSMQLQTFDTIFSYGKDAINNLSFVEKIAYAVVLAMFFLVSTLVFFVLFLLFFARIIILWLLVVLAPLAFGAYILPATKKYWTQWFSQLVQWSIIGIPIGFFLYLSNTILNLGGGVITASPGLTGDVGFLGGFISSILSPIVGIAVLLFGIALSMQMAPAAAQGIIDRGKKAGIGLGLWAGSNTWREVGGKLEKLGAGIRQKGQTMEANAQEKMQTAGLGLRAKAWAGISRFAVAKPTRTLGSLLEIGTGDVNKRVSEKIRRVMGEGEKAAQGKSYQEASTLMQRELAKPGLRDWDRVAGYVNGIIKNGDSEDLMKDIESGRFSMDKMTTIYKNSKMGGSPFRRPIEKALLKYALDNETTGAANPLGVSKEHQKELLEQKMTGVDIKDIIAPQNLDLVDPANAPQATRIITQLILKSGGKEVLTQLFQNGSLEQRQKIQELLEGIGAETLIAKGRRDIVIYMQSTPAGGLGLRALAGAESMEKIKDMELKMTPGYSPELEAKTQEELEEQEARATQQLETLQKQRKTLERQYDAARNESAREQIRIKGRKTDSDIKEFKDRIQTIREDLRLRQMPIEDLGREAETLHEQIRQINMQTVAQRDYVQRDRLDKKLLQVQGEIGRKTPARKPEWRQPQEDPLTTQRLYRMRLEGNIDKLKTRIEMRTRELNAATRDLEKLLQQAQDQTQAQGPSAVLNSAYKQQEDNLREKLRSIDTEIEVLREQQKDETGRLKQIIGVITRRDGGSRARFVGTPKGIQDTQQKTQERASRTATPKTPQNPYTQTRPEWLNAGLESMRAKTGARVGIPVIIPRRLEKYLLNKGVSNEEIGHMTPQQAWRRAEELSRIRQRDR